MANWFDNSMTVLCPNECRAVATAQHISTYAETWLLYFYIRRKGKVIILDFRSRNGPPEELVSKLTNDGFPVLCWSSEQYAYGFMDGEWTNVRHSRDMPEDFWQSLIEAGLLTSVPRRGMEEAIEDAKPVLDAYAEAKGVGKGKLGFDVIPSHGGIYVNYRVTNRLGTLGIVQHADRTANTVITVGKRIIDMVALYDWIVPKRPSYDVGDCMAERVMEWLPSNCVGSYVANDVWDSEGLGLRFADEADRALFRLKWL